MKSNQIILSICIPTYNRPDLLQRALASVSDNAPSEAQNVEIIISDNSTNNESEAIVDEFKKTWPGTVLYRHNQPGLPRIENQNQAISMASGEWIQVLHDDDFLLPDGLPKIITDLINTSSSDRVLLFGVHVVDPNNQVLRTHTYKHNQFFPPPVALQRLLSNSSMVRMPAILIHRDAYAEIGLFESGYAGKEDFLIYIRLFSTYGLRVLPSVTCAYYVHPGADSYAIFNEEAITILTGIFQKFVPQGLLPEHVLRRAQTRYFHQFILAGTYRRLRLGDRIGARKVIDLFKMPEIRKLGLSPRWALIRLVFTAACLGAKDRKATQS